MQDRNERIKIRKSVFATLTKVHFSAGLKQYFRDLANELSINPDAICREISCVSVHVLGMNIKGLCIRNENRGFEFYNPEFLDEPVTLVHPGTSLIPHKQTQRTKECYVFYSLLDYMAFKNLQYEDNLPKEASKHRDCLIIGNESNLIDTMLDADIYSKIYCLFPCNLVGRTINRTFIHRNPRVNIDLSGFYQESISLFEYNKQIKNKVSPSHGNN